jgi:hypothetical protein
MKASLSIFYVDYRTLGEIRKKGKYDKVFKSLAVIFILLWVALMACCYVFS